MDSREEELNADGHRLNMATENSDTTTLQKKQARRVSFAETTLVRIFDRDEECNLTPLSKNANSADQLGSDVNDNIDDEDEAIGTPCPGGSTFGSASSNDEDNFFGPVSANFIRPGRLSDSAASDDNHDVTMDSTAFSMHYRSLARSDSGADSETPSAGELFLEERTAVNAIQGRSMDCSLDKKVVLESLMSTSEVSGSHISSNMSLVVENPIKYEYEKLSPGLDFKCDLFSIESMRAKHGTTDTSPLVTPWSENKLIRHFFKTRPSSEDAVMGEIVDTHDRKELFGILDKTIPHSKENKSLVRHPRTMDLRSQVSSPVSVGENSMNGTQHKTIPHGTIANDSSLQKNLVEIPRDSPSRNEIDDMHASEKPTSETFQLSGRRDNLSSSDKKLDLAHRVAHRKNEVTVSQRSPKRQKFDDCELLCPDEGRLTLAGQSIRFMDVYSKNLVDMKCFLSGSAVRLHNDMIDAMEDILASQQRSKMYELCHHELIMSQNAIVPCDGWHKQMADTKSLLQRVVFEKIKLQLKHMKKERLLKRLQLLNNGIQESQVLRANLMSHPFLTSNANPTANAIGYTALSVKLKNGPEVSSEKLTGMRHTLEAIEMEISNLTKSFHKRCKLKAKPSSGGIIAAVNEHLIKKASCRLFRSDMQIWAVNSFASSSCQHNIGLSYLDLVIQRIHIMRGPRLSAKTSFVLNEDKIMKNFPNMDACTAFAFLFHETVHELFDSRTLPWETQVTSSILGALLDVVNEVQLAQMELPYLTQTRFCSPADQLHLVLCFFNWTNSGRKVTLTLDMTCLKRGIYPSEIVPLEVKCSSSASIPEELKEEVKTIPTGYTRILRLCRSVSKWLQASTP